MALALGLALAPAASAQQGDLWICSGQSNMELPVSRCMDAVEEAVSGYVNPEVNYLKVPLAWNFDWPQKALPEGCFWQALDAPEKAQSWGALAYFTGRGLQEATGAPQYMFNSSVGGSPIEAWLPAEELPDYAQRELLGCRDKAWMDAALYHNAHLYSDWQNAVNAAPLDPDAQWQAVEMFSDWGLENGQPVFGSHYLKNTFRLKSSQVKADAVLHLGAMRDADSVFVNGHFVGNTTYQYPPRNYKVPASYLRKGENVVEIHLYAADNAAAFVPGKQYSLETAKGDVDLTKGWQYKRGRKGTHRGAQIFLQYKASGLYNAMIAPIPAYLKQHPGLNLKGVIWYQGESNAGRADNYEELLLRLIESWRTLLGDPDLPFYIVELAAYEHSELETASTSGWVRVQDAQRAVAEKMENVYVVPNRDLGEWNDIHPQDKKTLGERTVNVILNR